MQATVVSSLLAVMKFKCELPGYNKLYGSQGLIADP
jgi:hypothetical protein